MRDSRSGSIQRRLRHLAATFGIVVALPAMGGEVTLYEHDSFRGRSFITAEAASNVADVGFRDRGASAIVRSGSWQLCTDAFFRGRCETLQPGEYPTLRSMRLDSPVLSVREVGWVASGPGHGAPAGPGRPGPGSAPAPRAMVELYEFDGFGGRTFSLNDAVSNFPSNFNDRAGSMIIHSGQWEACENIGYHGSCQVYGPGRYVNLGAMANRISSIRPVAGSQQPTGPHAGPPWGGGGARAILYTNGNFSGRSVLLNHDVVANLATMDFNDRASSLRIEGGYWMFCTEANFTGECQTFGPGDYATLPGLNNRVSSGRRIRDHYPYSQSPNWQR